MITIEWQKDAAQLEAGSQRLTDWEPRHLFSVLPAATRL